MHPPATPRRPRRTVAALAGTAALLGTLTACGAGTDPTPPPSITGATTASQGPQTPEPPELTRRDVDAWLDGMLPAALDGAGIAGAGVAVVHDGEVLTTRGYGLADIAARLEVDPERTLFRIASVSKVFTATAVMQLVERGEVDLDTDVEEYLDFDLPTSFDTPVTLRHLLTHTAGFEEQIRGLIRGPGVEVDLRDTLATDPPEQVYEPGTVPAYSNYGNALAGYVVERVSGQAFEEYAAENVLGRAGMDSSSFAQPLPRELARRLSQGYADDTSPGAPFETVGTAPAGSLAASTDDMARFMLAQLGDRGAGEPLLRPATLRQMHAPALDEDALGGLAAGPRMTLGFFDRSRNGHRVLEHGGDTEVFHSDLELFPDDGTGIFVTLNSSGRDPVASVVLRDQLLAGFADRYYPDAGGQRPRVVDDETAREHAELVAGTYESSRTPRSTFISAAYVQGQTRVTAEADGRLLFSPGPNRTEPVRYEEVKPWVWREVDGDREIAARVVDGRVEAIGVDSAFALLPVASHRSADVILPVVGGSALVLLLGSVGWVLTRPVQWVRRRRGDARRLEPAGRTLRVLTRVGVGAAALALVGWVLVVSSVMGLGGPPTAAIRAVQVLQAIGLVGVAPAALRLADEVRRRAGWRQVLTTSVVLAALVAVGWVAVGLRMLSPDISY